MPETGCTLAYITAGAAGMYCGSCMHDNTLARALTKLGIDVLLVPTYTPLRTDEENVSIDRLFFGGINVFLEQFLPLYRYLPSVLGSLFDRPWLVRWATARASATNARFLGDLTVSMLRGAAGNQRREVTKLSRWLKVSVRPQLIVFSNMLIAGSAATLRAELGVPILVTLQGDDAFLEALPEPQRSQSLGEIRRLVAAIDGFLVHSDFYADCMHEYFGIPAEKMFRVPLGVDTAGFPPPGSAKAKPSTAEGRSPRAARNIGYLARLAPQKGLHLLVEAFIDLRRRAEMHDVGLRVAGWLGEDQRSFAEAQFSKLDRAGLGEFWHYAGSVDRVGKLAWLQTIDVLSVPTTYRDPKGLFVLESFAAGVPVVQPSHGAFPELLATLGGGLLVPPHDVQGLANALHTLLTDDDLRGRLGRQGAEAVHQRFHAESMAQATWEVFRRFLDTQ
jgi:glycosyltransferase involved in cell wall biosynthesis